MHDAVFHDVPGVFQNPYQSEPLDLGTPWFYKNRKKLIDDRILQIKSMSAENITTYVQEFYSAHEGEALRGVSWRYGVEKFATMASCLGGKAIAAICLRL